MPDPDKVARICKALSVPSRVKILQILKVSSLCVNALTQELGMTAAAVSQHLRILRDADLIRPEKRGYYVNYVLDWEVLERWRYVLETLLTPPLDRIVGGESPKESEDEADR
ncbi:MAG: metalloregulator ArsR/SmtB family transcription factor [Desulfovermiculus sp.]